MLYANITYESILARMIGRVEGWARLQGISIDTREGSLIRTALSPAAAELKQLYIELDEVLNETFADTASREFLIKRSAERGIVPAPATKAIRQGEFNIDVAIGARFSLGRLNYTVVERISEGVYKLECESPGNAGNLESGPLLPIDYIQGLETAKLTAVLTPGEDEETTEHLRRRYFEGLESQAFGGNIADYREKVSKLPGVGGCKVYPAWDGGGTVKVVVINSLFQRPSDVLVDEVQAAIDPEQNHGAGMGIAPIGHTVTAEPVGETIIDVDLHIVYQPGWDWDAVKPYVEATIDQYFAELSEEWDKVNWVQDPDAALVVRISQIETRLLGVAGILDVGDTTLNSDAQNLMLDADNIPVRGVVSDV